MDMGRNKKMVSYALDPAVLTKLEAWIAQQPVPPSKTAVVEKAITEFVERNGGVEERKARQDKKG